VITLSVAEKAESATSKESVDSDKKAAKKTKAS